MADGLEIVPVRGMGEVSPGADLAAMIVTAAPWLRDGDILVVTSKIVSKAEGQLIEVPVDGPEREALREEVLQAQTARTIARRGHTRIVQTHHGFVLASAGIDASNVDRTHLVLLPKDPDASARALRSTLQERHGLDVAVIISDTMGRPWRNGLTDVALGVAGIDAVIDYRGELDAYGNELHITQMAVVDELAGAADLVKGKREQIPVAVVRGYPRPAQADAGARDRSAVPDGSGAAVLVRAADQDLFSMGTAEARAAGLRAAAELTDAPGFTAGAAQVDVDRIVAGTRIPVSLAEVTGLPEHTLAALRPDPPADAADVHRLRCLFAAEGLATIWLPGPGVLAVGHP